jgi:glutaredoxin
MKPGWIVALALVLIGSAAQAQYRWRGDDGQVNYGDQPPFGARELQRVDGRAPMNPNDPNAALPFELRRAIARHPAVLYTSGECPGCDAARVYLRQRGIPYSERTVEAAEDLDTLRKLTGSDKVPVLTLPGIQLRRMGARPRRRRLPGGLAPSARLRRRAAAAAGRACHRSGEPGRPGSTRPLIPRFESLRPCF